MFVDLYKGKKFIGHYKIKGDLVGRYMPFPYMHKDGRVEEIIVPIISYVVSSNSMEYHVRRVLDVTRKSKRQIDMIKSFEGYLAPFNNFYSGE